MKTTTLALAAALAAGGAAHAQEAVQWRVEDGGNGHWYRGVPRSAGTSFDGARADALASGGDLATLELAGENEWVFAAVASNPDLWIAQGNPNAGCCRFGPWLAGPGSGRCRLRRSRPSWHVLWIPDFDGSNLRRHIDTEAAQEHHNLGDEGWHADLEALFEPLDGAIDDIAIELWDHDCEAFLNRGRLDDHIFGLIVAARTTLRNTRHRERRIVEMLIMHHGGTWSTVALANCTDEEDEDAAAPSTTDVRALTISGDGVRRVLGNLESLVERGRREEAEVEKRTEGWTIYQHFDNDSPGWGDSSIADLVRTLHLAASTCTTSPTFRSTLSAELKSSRKSNWYQDLIDVVEGRGQGLDIVDCFKGVSETTQTDDGSSACGLSWYWTRAYTVGKDGERAEKLASTLEACVQIAMDAAEAAGEHHETDPPWYPEDLGSEHDFDFDR